MTTIAYSKGQLAADSRATDASILLSDKMKKILVLKDGTHVGFAGGVGPCQEMMRSLKEDDKFDPDVSYDNKEVESIAVTSDGRLYFYCDEFSYYAELTGKEHFAIGSGGDFALGALVAGVDLKAAMEVAKTIDTGTGGEIHIYDVVKPKSTGPVGTNSVVTLRRPTPAR